MARIHSDRLGIRVDSGCWYDTRNQRLDLGEPERAVLVDGAYIETQAPIVRGRLVKAGLRRGGLPSKAVGDSTVVPDLHR
jgi:hypothetical protein